MRLGQALGDPHPSGFSERQRSRPRSNLKGRHSPALPRVKVQELGPRPQHHVVRMATSKHPHGHVQASAAAGDALGTQSSRWGIAKATWCSRLGRPALRAAAC